MDLDHISRQIRLALNESLAIQTEMRELRRESDDLRRLAKHVREDVIIALRTELHALLAGLEARVVDAIEVPNDRNGRLGQS